MRSLGKTPVGVITKQALIAALVSGNSYPCMSNRRLGRQEITFFSGTIFSNASLDITRHSLLQ